MINTSVVVEDNRLISLILDFLNSRNFHTTMRSLEKESGVVNLRYSKDILFLRDLVLDGEWEAILIFAQPFEGIEGFDIRLFRYIVLKQKFMEVLYFKSGFGGGSTCYSIEDLIKCLNQLEQDCPSKTEYSKLCWLLTVPNLPEQPEYRDWNPATARIRCFEQILELLRKAIPIERKSSNETSPKSVTPTKDRLLHLVIKGLCFESCVEYCQLRAINGSLSEDLYFHIKDNILNGPKQESSGNFLSWLRNLSQEAFVTPFEPLSLEVDLKSVKQVKSSSLLKSPKRDDVEILSRSLALSGRPATADIFADKHAFDRDKRSEGKPASRPHTAQSSRVSQSHYEFHYRGTSGKEIPASISNEFNEVINDRELENGHKDSLKKVPSIDNYISVKADDVHPSQPFEVGNCSTQQYTTPQTVHFLKEEQQKNVLRQLEAHEKQKLELQRELMELSQRETNREEGREDPADFKLYDRNKGTRESLKSLTNEGSNGNVLYQSPGVSLQFTPLAGKTIRPEDPEDLKQGFSSLVQANVNSAYASGSIPQSNLICTSGVQDPAQATSLPSFLVSSSMTSTPATKTKHKPENLDITETTGENSVVDTIPVTPADQIFPLTPAGAVGHWVALSDGSGVLNTSTPKSKRQVMSSTPAPPASPVLSANSTSNCGTPLTTGEAAVSSSVGDRHQQTGATFDPTKDKETPGGYVQQAAIKRGPKVNGVRRSLAPQTGTKQKAGANVDNRGTTPPIEEPQMPSTDTQAARTVKSKVTGSATPRVHQEGSYIREELVQSRLVGFRGKGNNTKNGTTFLVDQGAVGNHPTLRKTVEEETEHGGCIKEHKDSSVENVKEQLLPRNSETINMTYRKPSSTTPPNNTTVTVHHNNHVSSVEKQRNGLHSLSDIQFYAVAKLEDVQAVRAIAFHPSGDLFAIGSNSKMLRVCTSEGLNSLQRINRKRMDQPPQPTVLFKSNRHHRGSIYCIAWSPAGDIIATGSNDKSIKMIRFDVETCTPTWPGMELAIHNGTIRDLAFVSKTSGTPVLVSGGAGDGNIAISDCGTGQTVGQLKGHSGHIMTVYAASDEIIASGSADNTVRLWDLRSQRCIDAIATGDSCVASVCVNSAGSMLASGHEDGSCMIYDITAGRTLQLFKPHTMDCRSVRFSPDNNFLLTGSYDTSIIMMDLRKDLEVAIPPYSVVAHHNDKVIQCRWHPHLTAFLSSSADKTATLWAPDFNPVTFNS